LKQANSVRPATGRREPAQGRSGAA